MEASVAPQALSSVTLALRLLLDAEVPIDLSLLESLAHLLPDLVRMYLRRNTAAAAARGGPLAARSSARSAARTRP